MAGTLAEGKLASFFITDKDYFEEDKVIVYQHWVQGSPYAIKELDAVTLGSNYEIKIGDQTFAAKVKGDAGSQSMQVTTGQDTSGVKSKLNISGGAVSLAFQPKGEEGFYRLNGTPPMVTTGSLVLGVARMVILLSGAHPPPNPPKREDQTVTVPTTAMMRAVPPLRGG